MSVTPSTGKRFDPIRNHPLAQWHDGILIVPITTPITVYVVLVHGSKRTRIDCMYDQRSLAQQHIDILNSSMRCREKMYPAAAYIIRCDNISTANELRTAAGVSSDDKIIQMPNVKGFHIFNSLLPDVGIKKAVDGSSC